MTLARDLTARLIRPDWVQLATLFFVALLFAWVVSAPMRFGQANASWYGVAPVRLIGLALLALGYGSALATAPRREQRATLLALALLAILSLPFEVLSYAVSYPHLPLAYTLALTLNAPALFGVGVLLGRVLSAARLAALLPLVAPAALAGMVGLDIFLGVTLLSPITALTGVSPLHLGVLAALTAATLVALWRPDRHAAAIPEGASP